MAQRKKITDGLPPDAAHGAAYARKCLVELFDQADGRGVEWRLIADALFRAAFGVLDQLPADQKAALARRVHAGAYERVTGGCGLDRPEP